MTALAANTSRIGDEQAMLRQALAYADYGLRIFPVDAKKEPIGRLTPHWRENATTDPEIIRRWWEHVPFADIAWALPADRLALDVDIKSGLNGYWDFERLAGCKPQDVATPQTSSPSGGMHLIYSVAKPYANRTKIKDAEGKETGLDIRAEGGYIVLPGPNSGRHWLKSLRTTPIAPIPEWLDAALQNAPKPTRAHVRAGPTTARAKKAALNALAKAHMKIVSAPEGVQEGTFNREIYIAGLRVGSGALDRDVAYDVLKDAGTQMPDYDREEPWTEKALDKKINRSLDNGIRDASAPSDLTDESQSTDRVEMPDVPESDASESDSDASASSPSDSPEPSDRPEKTISSFESLLAHAYTLTENDDVALRGFIQAAAGAGLSEVRLDKLARTAAKTSKFSLPSVRKALEQAEAQKAAAARDDPAAKAAARIVEAAVRRVEEARLWDACKELALAPDLMDRIGSIGDRLDVVGEGAATRGAYLVMTSRLLKTNALSLLRRGAPAGGKNYLVLAILRLMPLESVVRISGASPTALIYYGGGDEDALAHKVIMVAEAAAIAAKASGDENPTTVLLRTLLSEGRIDRLVTVPQKEGLSVSVQVTRNGPVSLILTSARDNVDAEMLTRLLVADVDESREQTLAIVKRRLASAPAAVSDSEIETWVALQRWLEIGGPYDVMVPFAEAIYTAYEALIVAFPAALQVRMRRDVGALLTAIKTSAILHRAQRTTDESGRLVATSDDYKHAWRAFNVSVSSLYGVRTRAEIIATVRVAETLGAVEKGDSVKITVAALRKGLGINSNDVAATRLQEAVEQGALEEDHDKRGSSRFSPRFFKLLIPSAALKAEPGLGVFPEPSAVK
jgi:hypothetical protein